YRLTSETITGDPVTANNGKISYTYDAIGNRLTRSSTVAAVPTAAHAYDANDRLASDTSDNNGNTIAAGGAAYGYDFENRITSLNGGDATFVHDGDGNRVAKTSGGVTTRYLVDDRNRTGFAQVVEEITNGSVQRVYTYGRRLMSQHAADGVTSFYGYDGQRSVRLLTDASGSAVESYRYDAFGNLLQPAGTVANVYRYAGEQFDPDLNLIYLRARYLDPATGRFRTMDPHPGTRTLPLTLHKYLYGNASPVDNVDPSGLFTLSEAAIIVAVVGVITGLAVSQFTGTKPGDVPLESGFPRAKELEGESEFIRAFTEAARQHYADVGSVTSGTLNNLCAAAGNAPTVWGGDETLGDGCSAWQDWIVEWFAEESARHRPKWDKITVERLKSGWLVVGTHRFARANLPIMGRLILDPWRNVESPIWNEDVYLADFGVTIESDE
ncbi:MAG: hypothetical protein HYZ72_09665, partial [Deltaproteobacteria bacterium]|nr:hypothetical protein [Deltaproteobacteria bacterium]